MADTLLWSLEETARQLGNVSIKTIRRMINSGQLSAVKVRRSLKIIPDSARTHIDKNRTMSDTGLRTSGERKPRGKRRWHSNATQARSGGSLSQIRAAKELSALQEQPIARKQKH